MLTRRRSDTTKNPLVPAVQKWLAKKYEKEIALVTTLKEKNRLALLYKDVPDDFIWVEYIKQPVNIGLGQFLCCFSVLRRGYGILDAKLAYIGLSDVIRYFNIPVKTVSNYSDLVKAIKAGQTQTLYKVKSGSGQYGICVDNRLPQHERYQHIIDTLLGVNVNVAVSYNGKTFTLTTPQVGEVSLMYPGMTTATLEVYPVEEIIKL